MQTFKLSSRWARTNISNYSSSMLFVHQSEHGEVLFKAKMWICKIVPKSLGLVVFCMTRFSSAQNSLIFCSHGAMHSTHPQTMNSRVWWVWPTAMRGRCWNKNALLTWLLMLNCFDDISTFNLFCWCTVMIVEPSQQSTCKMKISVQWVCLLAYGIPKTYLVLISACDKCTLCPWLNCETQTLSKLALR